MYTDIYNTVCISPWPEETSVCSLLDIHEYEKREREREIKEHSRVEGERGGQYHSQGIDISSTQHTTWKLDAERSRGLSRSQNDMSTIVGEKQGKMEM